MVKFEILDKSQFEAVDKDLFNILDGNMSVIAPTGLSFEENYNMWKSAVGSGLSSSFRNIVLILCDNQLVGYFQYYTNDEGMFMMEEIQLKSAYHGKKYNIFRQLFGFVLSLLPKNIKTVAANTSKQNFKMQGILAHLGLENIGENKNGRSYRYQGDFKKFMDWYNSK